LDGILMALYASNFSVAFAAVLEDSGVTCYQIAKYAGLDQGYLSRLKNGEKSNPGPETIMRISLALAHFGKQVSLSDIERLFRSVGRSITRE
jgi:transcriptional regulator with XRE-family HTH domain